MSEIYQSKTIDTWSILIIRPNNGELSVNQRNQIIECATIAQNADRIEHRRQIEQSYNQFYERYESQQPYADSWSEFQNRLLKISIDATYKRFVVEGEVDQRFRVLIGDLDPPESGMFLLLLMATEMEYSKTPDWIQFSSRADYRITQDWQSRKDAVHSCIRDKLRNKFKLESSYDGGVLEPFLDREDLLIREIDQIMWVKLSNFLESVAPGTYDPFRKPLLNIGELELDSCSNQVTLHGNEVKLLPKEYALLKFLMKHPDEVFSLEALLDRAWFSESGASTDSVYTCIKSLGKKLSPNGTSSIIKTVFGVGYKIETSELGNWNK